MLEKILYTFILFDLNSSTLIKINKGRGILRYPEHNRFILSTVSLVFIDNLSCLIVKFTCESGCFNSDRCVVQSKICCWTTLKESVCSGGGSEQ